MKATLFFDGLVEPTNPGGHGCYGFVLIGETGEVLSERGGHLGRSPSMTNNVAEYSALVYGLEEAVRLGVTILEAFGDSKLVVEQVNGNWRINKPHLQTAVNKARAILKSFERWSLGWVPREQNELADQKSREAYSAATGNEAPTRGVRV